MATTTRIITEADAWAHPEIGFIEPEIVPETGFWRVLKLDSAGSVQSQRIYRADARASVIAELRGVSDVYVSQAVFTGRQCKGKHVRFIPGAWVDLDIYRCPGLSDRPRATLIRQLLEHCDVRGVPRPSYTISSGRGLYMKWTYAEPARARDRPTCEAINTALAALFAGFGADPKVKDAPRVLRPVGSVNSKAAWTVVHVAHREDTEDGTPLRHDMAALQAVVDAAVAPECPEPKRSRRNAAARTRPSTARSQLATVPPKDAPTEAGRGWRTWNQRVFADITRLAELRWSPGTIPAGWRDVFAFHAAVQIAHLEPADQVMPAVRAWAARHLPAAFIANELEPYMQSVCERAWRAQKGETVEYQRQPNGPTVLMSPIYTFKRTQLLARLQITPAESAHLDVLIDDAEHRARERKRKADARRAQGCRTNAERGAARAAEADREAIKVEALRAQGRTWSQVADALGITEGSAQQRLRRLRKRRAERGDASAAGTPA